VYQTVYLGDVMDVHLRLKILWLVAVLGYCQVAMSQVDQDIEISGTYLDVSVVEFLQVLENKYGNTFYYHPASIPITTDENKVVYRAVFNVFDDATFSQDKDNHI